MKLRPAQEKILDYRQGKMAISAVPGSGKTTTLALLAAELIARGQLDPTLGRSILIVTYLNTSVENFRANIGRRLAALELPPEGFEVRTLHSLALEIVRAAFGGGPEGPAVADEGQANHLLARAVDSWTESNPALWAAFLSGGGPQHRVRWRDTTEGIARQFIREAKNGRLRSESVLAAVQQAAQTASGEVNGDEESTPDYGLLWMMAGIYDRYQSALGWQGVLDFDDLVWRSVDLIESRPDLAAALRGRWPYVLEDEAQDSVPLQETLLELLTGPDGNWVRVGDPNQAITSTFTAAHPRFFNHFLARPDVVALPLPNSGRSSRKIIGAANQVMEWACDLHPIPEVRETAFRRQEILPTPPGDSQPNPADAESDIRIRVYSHREDDELPAVARLAAEYARRRPEHTLAILVPTNEVGRKVSEQLDALDASYDDLLRGGGRLREIAAAIQAVVGVLANPQSGRALELALTSLYELGHPAAAAGEERFSRSQAIVRSVHRPETFLFPAADASFEQALPFGVADEDDLEAVGRFRDYLQELFELRPLPVDDLILALSDELFAGALASNGATDEGDLALGYRLANVAREWRDLQPSWRLPELAAQLAEVAAGRQRIPSADPTQTGYEPAPGRISLSTQHSAKGLEWDAVFVVGVDSFWVPSSLDSPFLGVREEFGSDPGAEVVAQMRELLASGSSLYPSRSATDSAHIEVISERLRLLYVSITRARRFLQISRSRKTRRYRQDHPAAPATVMGVLYDYVKGLP